MTTRIAAIRTLLAVLLFLVTLTTPCKSANNVYKWTDEQGQVHYGERKPRDFTTRELRLDPTGPTTTPDERHEQRQRQQQLLDSYDRKRQAKREASIKKRAEEEEREKLCAEARHNAEFFARAEGSPLARPDDAGKVEWVSDDQRASIREHWNSQIEQYCN